MHCRKVHTDVYIHSIITFPSCIAWLRLTSIWYLKKLLLKYLPSTLWVHYHLYLVFSSESVCWRHHIGSLWWSAVTWNNFQWLLEAAPSHLFCFSWHLHGLCECFCCLGWIPNVFPHETGPLCCPLNHPLLDWRISFLPLTVLSFLIKMAPLSQWSKYIYNQIDPRGMLSGLNTKCMIRTYLFP